MCTIFRDVCEFPSENRQYVVNERISGLPVRGQSVTLVSKTIVNRFTSSLNSQIALAFMICTPK